MALSALARGAPDRKHTSRIANPSRVRIQNFGTRILASSMMRLEAPVLGLKTDTPSPLDANRWTYPRFSLREVEHRCNQGMLSV